MKMWFEEICSLPIGFRNINGRLLSSTDSLTRHPNFFRLSFLISRSEFYSLERCIPIGIQRVNYSKHAFINFSKYFMVKKKCKHVNLNKGKNPLSTFWLRKQLHMQVHERDFSFKCIHTFMNFALSLGTTHAREISYERRVYESVGERAYLSLCSLCPEKRRRQNVVHKGFKKWKFPNYINPLTPRRTQVFPFTKISILF